MRPAIETLRKMFRYNPETGELIRVFPHGSTRVCPDTVQEGICRVSVGVNYRTAKSQVCWALHYGEWPEGFLDHKDRNPANHKIENLRPATKQQNLFNAGVRKDNQLGIKGVSYIPTTGKYRATIQKDGRVYRLGHFNSADRARDAYVEAAKKLFGEYAAPHG